MLIISYFVLTLRTASGAAMRNPDFNTLARLYSRHSLSSILRYVSSPLKLCLLLLLLVPAVVLAGAWGNSGILLRGTGESDPDGQVQCAKLVPANESLWVAWLDNRDDPNRYGGRIYVQAVSEEGIVANPDGGILLEGLGWCPDEQAFDVIPDGDGGLMVCTTDEDTPGEPKLIQRYNVNSQPVWDEPVCIPEVLWTQRVLSLGTNGMLMAVGMATEPSMLLAAISTEGEVSSWTIFSEPSARSTLPIGLFPRTGGYLALGRIIRTANTSDCRRLLLSYGGEPNGSTAGVVFYWGRVYDLDAYPLESNQAVFLVSGLEYNLLAQYFSSTGYAHYDYLGRQVFPGEATSFSACAAENGFWALVNQYSDGIRSIYLNRFNNGPNPQLTNIAVSNHAASDPVAPIIPDGAGGVFGVFRHDSETTPYVSLWDSDGERREGYEANIRLDPLSLEAEIEDIKSVWRSFIVTYRQDRSENNRKGLIVQSFPNTAPDDVPEAGISGLPETFSINTVYPNPFNSQTRVSLTVPLREQVQLTLYDVLGRSVQQWSLIPEANGILEQTIDLKAQAGGVYFLRAMQGDQTATARLLLVK